MKKVARLRLSDGQDTSNMQASSSNSDTMSVRTTGRKKKPKAVFDPSDNYLPRAQRNNIQSISPTHSISYGVSSSDSQLRAKSPFHGGSLASSMSTGAGGESMGVCEICSKREAKRGAHARNKLITCSECKKCVHKLCMLEEFSDFEKLRRLYKCEDCRSCSNCQAKFIDKRHSIICTKCVQAFHFECHTPPLQPVKFREATIRRNWQCKACLLTAVEVKDNFSSDEELIAKELARKPTYPTAIRTQIEPTKPSVPMLPYRKMSIVSNGTNDNSMKNKMSKIIPLENEQKSMLKKSKEINGSYNILEKLELPNVKDWNVEQVTRYMSKYFPKESHVFREHEIDGASLLLMRRSDVVKKLSLKLGPSLRIYSLILKIQTQSNDPTLGWNCKK